MNFRSPRRWIAFTGSAALLTATLLVIPEANAEPVDPGRPATSRELTDRFTGQPLAWETCETGPKANPNLKCTVIEAPIDYFHPDAGTVKVAFSRLATSIPAKRRGVLFFNPGGPGLSGLTGPKYEVTQLPKDVVEQFDLIGFDPRGVGRSTPIDCGLTGDEAVPQIPYEEDRFPQHIAAAKSAAAKCAAAGPTVGQISTRNTARDMDLIRTLLGEEKISYFGTSYGTYVGAVYTQLFPDRADRILLDSNMDPAASSRGWFEERTRAAGDRFDYITTWIAQRDATHHLGSSPAAVSRTFWDLVGQLKETPVLIKDSGERYTERHARWQMVEAASPNSAVGIITELRDALAHPGSEIPFGDYWQPAPDFASMWFAINCNDNTSWPRDQQTYLDDLARFRQLYPLAWDFENNITPCAFWSLPHPEPDLTVDNLVPALLLQNEFDRNTPLEGAASMHRALHASRLVVVKEAISHGVYGGDSTCATDIADTFLSTGVLPDADVTCPATP